MGITKTNSNITNVRYSSFLGMLYLQENENEVEQVKAYFGATVVKKGYSGEGSTPSGEAKKRLAEMGVSGVQVDGALESFRVKDVNANGKDYPYLEVVLSDETGKYRISLNMAQPGTQMLARKLVNAKVGNHVKINMFAKTVEKNGKTYANHGASLSQEQQEVIGVDPKETLAPMINAAKAALIEAGVDDKEIFDKKREKLTLEYHCKIIQDSTIVQDDFDASDLPEV